jgi:hypothetical protein
MPVTNAELAGELEKLADLPGVLDIWVLKVTRGWKKAWGTDAGCGRRILSGRKVDWGSGSWRLCCGSRSSWVARRSVASSCGALMVSRALLTQ